MGFWTAAVAIVAIIAFANLRRHRHAAPPWPDAGPADPAALVREVAELRARVEVLERILTDERGSRALAHEIEALRQDRPAGPHP